VERNILFETKWLQVLELKDPENGINGYVCTHAVWMNGKAISVLPYRVIVGQDEDGKLTSWREYLLRQEITPPWGAEPNLSSITGGMDVEGEYALDCAMRELHEEGGYIVGRDKEHLWVDLGTVHMGKASTTLIYLFAVDLTAEGSVDAPGDGTELEAKAHCEWRKDPENAVDVLVGRMVFGLGLAIDTKRKRLG
jgi:8-oxo-dGTP pyrophosphatase MutT (NUDIX family)